MITIVGTGHVFNIAEPVAFIVRNTWPDAVLVELDQGRLDAMTRGPTEDGKGGGRAPSPIYDRTSRYQQRMSEEHGSRLGAEFLAAVNAGRLAGAEIIPIDTDAMRTMDEMWDEMSASERLRYRLSGISDSVGGKRKVASVQRSFAEDEERYVEAMRRRYPTLVRKLIDERNEHMASQIMEAAGRFDNMVVIVGDAHVEGISALLEGQEVRRIRLADLMDKERMDAVRDMVWKGESARGWS